MANISLKRLFEAEDFKAKSKETGKLVHFKSKDAYQAAIKAGTHEDPKAKKGETPKAAAKPNDMFGADYKKDRGSEAPKAAATSKYDDESYWKDDERGEGSQSADDSGEYDDSWGDAAQLTADKLDKIEKAINDEFGKDFSFDRQFGGGDGGFEGPLQVFAKGKGEDGYSISIGSNGQDGKFSIGFLEPGGEEMLFEPNWDPINGENELTAQQAYKVTKYLMKLPEVQKLLKGEMKPKQFGPTYAKIKDKFANGKTESTKLTSMIKR